MANGLLTNVFEVTNTLPSGNNGKNPDNARKHGRFGILFFARGTVLVL